MDGTRFDDLTRALATGTSRRRALGLLAAALGGALAGRRGNAAAQGCRRLGRRCDGSRPCCAGLACLEGACVPAAVEDIATCVPPFDACAGGERCCPGANCAGGVCCPVGLACGDVCCGNGTVCLNGACATPGGAFLCLGGQRLCGAAGCRDLASDPANCGSCGRACPSGPNGTAATCANGVCGSACAPGFKRCVEGGPCLPLAACCAAEECPTAAAGTCEGERTCVDGVCGFAPATQGTVCRADANVCAQEVCDGASLACPADGASPNTLPCTVAGAPGTCQCGTCRANSCTNLAPGTVCLAPEGGCGEGVCQADGRCCVPSRGFPGGVPGQFCLRDNCCRPDCRTGSTTLVCV